MLRFSYEWIEEDGEPHWSDELYGIYDAKRGYTDPIAYTWHREDGERIVDALNATEGKRRTSAYIFQRCVETDSNDLSDLLD